MSASIGQKVRFFRKRAGLSQLKLESEINAANGSISRIENDETNPTKETLLELSKILKLNEKEKDYLIGITSEPATQTEIESAIADVRDILDLKTELCYLIDDRGRLIEMSRGFLNLFGVSDELILKFIKKSFISFVLNSESKVLQHLNPENVYDVFYNMISLFYSEMSYILDDECMQESLEAINSVEVGKQIWEVVKKENNYRYQSNKERTVTFLIEGKPYESVYSISPILNHRRFELVEYAINPELRSLLNSL